MRLALWVFVPILIALLVLLAWFAPALWCHAALDGISAYECNAMFAADPLGGVLTEQFWSRLLTLRL